MCNLLTFSLSFPPRWVLPTSNWWKKHKYRNLTCALIKILQLLQRNAMILLYYNVHSKNVIKKCKHISTRLFLGLWDILQLLFSKWVIFSMMCENIFTLNVKLGDFPLIWLSQPYSSSLFPMHFVLSTWKMK